jgi:hypothetical protein
MGHSFRVLLASYGVDGTPRFPHWRRRGVDFAFASGSSVVTNAPSAPTNLMAAAVSHNQLGLNG